MKKFYQLTTKSLEDLGVTNLKEVWEKVKGEHEGLCSSVEIKFKAVEDSKTKFDVVMSTENEDRHGDIVKQEWDLRPFKKNNVLLDSHNYGSIEHILGKVTKVMVDGKKLTGRIEFAVDANPKAEMALKLVQGGFLNAVSVGFIPLEFDKEFNILKSELIELSVVSVPANADALISKGMDEEEEQEDEEAPVFEIKKTKGQKRLEILKQINKEYDEKDRKKTEFLEEATNIIKDLSEKQKVETPPKANQKVNRITRLLSKYKKLNK